MSVALCQDILLYLAIAGSSLGGIYFVVLSLARG